MSATVIGDFSPRGGLSTLVTAYVEGDAVESAELIALLHEVRDRVRARNPETAAGGVEIALPDLMPLAHARDAALGKVAAIGTVNPRPGGVVNSLVQAWKRMISRVLDWHVREQVEFNRKSMACIDAALEAMADYNRALVALGSRMAAQEQVGEELKDIRNHWADWRFEWEHKLQQNEMQFLRSVADLQGGFQHRATLMDANYRDAMRGQHAEFTGALERFSLDIQKRLWADLERIRLDYERLIYSELKTIRQRAAVSRLGGCRECGAPGGRRRRVAGLRLRPLCGALPRHRGIRQGGPAVLSALLPRLPQRARYRLRPRRIPGNDAVRGRPGQGHRSQRGIGGHLPAQGARRRGRGPVRLSGKSAGSFAGRHLLFAGGGASAAGAPAGDDPLVRQPAAAQRRDRHRDAQPDSLP